MFRDRYWPAIIASEEPPNTLMSPQEAYRGIMARKGGDPETRVEMTRSDRERDFVERACERYVSLLKSRREFDVLDFCASLERRWRAARGHLWGSVVTDAAGGAEEPEVGVEKRKKLKRFFAARSFFSRFWGGISRRSSSFSGKRV